MRISTALLVCLCLSACNSGSDDGPSSSTPRYIASRLDVVANNFFGTSGINGRGDVAGYGGGFPLITWDGNLEKLPLPGDADVGQAVALNDSRQVIGWGQKGPQIGRVYTGFLMTGGVMQLLPGAIPVAINSRGDVVGYKSPGGFLLTGNAMIDLPGPLVRPSRINDRGDVVGSYIPASPPDARYEHPFVYSGGKLTDLGINGEARDINASGDIVGSLRPDPASSTVRHAFLYSRGKLTDLGTLGGTSSEAVRIDASGRIVGYVTLAPSTARTFLYVQGVTYDLKTLIASGVAADDLPIGSIGVVDMNGPGQILVSICSVECKAPRTYLLYPD